MNHRTILLALAIACPASAHAAELAIEGAGLERSVPCNGKDVGIYGAGHTIELTGACGAIVVHGDGHSVTFEDGAALTITGIGHAVRGGTVEALVVEGKGSTVAVSVANGEEAATVVVSGAEHEVTLDLASAAELVVNGLKHRVRWAAAQGAPEPDIQIAGFDSTVEKSD